MNGGRCGSRRDFDENHAQDRFYYYPLLQLLMRKCAIMSVRSDSEGRWEKQDKNKRTEGEKGHMIMVKIMTANLNRLGNPGALGGPCYLVSRQSLQQSLVCISVVCRLFNAMMARRYPSLWSLLYDVGYVYVFGLSC